MRLQEQLDSIKARSSHCLWSAVLFPPAYLFFDLSRFGLASPAEIALQAFYQGMLMSGVALVTSNRAVSVLGSSAATAIIALPPAAASILAVPILGETASTAEWASIAAIVLGVLLAAKPARPGSSPNVPHPQRRRS